MRYFLFFSTTILLFLSSCQQQADFKARIDGLEARLAAQYTPERSDSLVNLYKEAVAADLDDHATNFKYLTRAAEIQFSLRSDGASASRWVDDALVHHSANQSLAEPIGLLARIWNAYSYKSPAAARFHPDDVNAIRGNLEKYNVWLDSALILIDSKMQQNGLVTDKAAVARFIETSEGYANFISGINPAKAAKVLMKAAGAAKTVDNFNKAIQLYASVSDRMGDQPDAPAALFMQGFIYENDLKNLDKAKNTYNFFLQRYPDNPDYVDDVKMSLKNLGKSPEEMIKEFEKK